MADCPDWVARGRWSVVALAWAALATEAAALQAKAVVRGELGKTLERLVEAQEPEFWGAVLVAPGGEVALARGFGLGKGGQKKTGSDSLFDVGSISKTFTAVAVLELARTEALALDDSISKWLPEVPQNKQAITLRHLLQHSSGYPRSTDGYKVEDFNSREGVVRAILGKPLDRAPGVGFEYSNVNYTLLAAVIEAVTDKSFEDFVGKAVFDRCKLENTSFAGWTGRKIERKHGTDRIGDGPRSHVCDYPWTWGKRGVTSVVTSGLDMLRFAQALRSGPLLDDAGREALFQPGPGSYAAGLEVIDGPGGKRLYGHRGQTDGYGSAFSLDRDNGTTVIVLTREQATAVRIREALEAALAATAK